MYDTLIADSTHQTSTLSQLTFKHLSQNGTKSCIAAHYTPVYSVCGLEVTACFTLASATNFSQPGASLGVQKHGNHWTQYCHMDL